ncbi:MAG: hypothetical protein DBW78_04510 [Rhodothermaeota bacterium MED-G64]|mgnify:CR=1 FL=1|nr:MAG: hypothetical protein DBW78_04510 [Rhodothermaeota bacterium MED-G64]RPF81157.1 MAG: hypothetical protein CBC65_003175 [Rhodothermaceae bacterium TMED105]RPF81435.1 MAG: hypothetical protein CBC65_002675 [Rhodothermaceae bacterium TMED105]HBD42373.1 hypothetical protein [Bacteroidota bacterium]|tara:strand:+ start:726 stop:1610 length:885 start_codon:yes stop_codon:yes gene_type:complete
MMKKEFLLLVVASTALSLTAVVDAFGQLTRERANPNAPVELTFMAPRHIQVMTVEPLSKGELHYSIMHTFGEIGSGPRNAWGIDYGANVRMSLEYGLGDQFSAYAGRSSMDKVFDGGFRWHVVQQTRAGATKSRPVSVSLQGGFGYNGSDYGYLETDYDFDDRWHGVGFLHLARKMSEDLSLQLSGGAVGFSRVGPETQVFDASSNVYAGAMFSGRYKVSSRLALTWEVMPRFSENVSSTVYGGGLDIEVGGHVFQLYVVSSQSLNDGYLLAAESANDLDGFRLGFNINRIFAL